MNEVLQGKDFVGYEYREVTVKKAMQSVYTDSYGSFGWIAEGTEEAAGKVDSVIMKFKRSRKIMNKTELTRLQRQFEVCVTEIVSMKRSEKTIAAVIAYIVGVIGTAFMAGSVFALTGGSVPLCAALAVPGLIGWIIPYLIYRVINKKKTEIVEPLIEQKYNELYDVCKRAAALLG